MLVPKKSSHAPADAAPSELTQDKKLVNIPCVNVTQPVGPDPMTAKPAIEVPILARYAPFSFAQIEEVSWE